MAEKKESSSYEILKNIKLDKDEAYVPGDNIPKSKLSKEQAEDLIVQGVIGGQGSYKKQQDEAKVTAVGDAKDVAELLNEYKETIQKLQQENKALREQLAKKK